MPSLRCKLKGLVRKNTLTKKEYDKISDALDKVDINGISSTILKAQISSMKSDSVDRALRCLESSVLSNIFGNSLRNVLEEVYEESYIAAKKEELESDGEEEKERSSDEWIDAAIEAVDKTDVDNIEDAENIMDDLGIDDEDTNTTDDYSDIADIKDIADDIIASGDKYYVSKSEDWRNGETYIDMNTVDQLRHYLLAIIRQEVFIIQSLNNKKKEYDDITDSLIMKHSKINANLIYDKIRKHKSDFSDLNDDTKEGDNVEYPFKDVNDAVNKVWEYAIKFFDNQHTLEMLYGKEYADINNITFDQVMDKIDRLELKGRYKP